MAHFDRFLVSLALLCALQMHICIADSFVCRDDFSGAPVDWWITYKFPSGTSYAYMDANTYTSGQWKISGKDLNDESSALGATLIPMYSAPTGYIMWNDAAPDGRSSSSKAHAKGMMTLDTDGGFFLRHSVPGFPEDPAKGGYSFPKSGNIFGQTLLCITMKTDQLDLLAGQYIINNPYIYAQLIPDDIYSNFTYFNELVQLSKRSEREAESKEEVASNILEVYSAGGVLFTDFAKNKAWDQDLYDDLVAPYYRTNLIVESWGRPLMPPKCDGSYSVMNVQEISFSTDVSFVDTKDHAKWAASPMSSNKPLRSNPYVTCIGDINRMKSQRKRGGGATCIINPSINASFNNLVTQVEAC